MPDDNIVVWNAMNPTEPGGNVAAPYQFPLYSQIGLAGSLIGNLVVGLLLGLLWRVAVSRIRGREAASTFGALVVLLAIYLAIDSVRNSILVSYGVIWGIGALGLMVIASSGARYGARRYRRYRAQRRTASASTASSRSA